jgi:transposase-like protein
MVLFQKLTETEFRRKLLELGNSKKIDEQKGASYSKETKAQLLQLLDYEISIRELAKITGFSEATIYKWRKQQINFRELSVQLEPIETEHISDNTTPDKTAEFIFPSGVKMYLDIELLQGRLFRQLVTGEFDDVSIQN